MRIASEKMGNLSNPPKGYQQEERSGMILEDSESDIKQINLLIRYHGDIRNNARLYSRPSEEALENFTVLYLKELKGIRVKEANKWEKRK